MTKFNLGCMIITSKNHTLLGIITDGVIRKNLHLNILNSKVSDLMHENPIAISESILVVEAINIMNVNSITNLPVINKDKKVIGIIHMHDCLRSGANPKI